MVAAGGDASVEHSVKADILLVTCVKTKQEKPCAAKDLYTSTLFKKQRAFAENLGVAWFILSAEHGLVAPDEWLAPYERYLPDTPAVYRTAWAGWVAERLDLLAGPVAGKVIEIHASAPYLNVVRPLLEAKGATVVDPLKGLAQGERLAWYSGVDDEIGYSPTEVDDRSFVERLRDASLAVSPSEFLSAGKQASNSPGLYSWWVDEAGAADISDGLGLPVSPGLIYAGLAGATRWPSGKRSTNTLWLRIATMHLGGNHEFSTFRRTLGAILAEARGSRRVDEGHLSKWMLEHLQVVTVAFDDRDELGRLETRVLATLDPPLNLKSVAASSLRKRLTALRKMVTSDQ
ncbi:hypothetical protein CRM90_10875 [Mycobacterium sp. ENV421]|uniref:DUF6884 domain-containing protein n=1 Tax=Mycobacterium sp. ENV421 TaxID=1213407 RepID=UPI000C9BAC45|nr:DUF6884 domain-containing protein [Mycobacterium sp. ENV421]PND57507.1 hypothetical protein CRM90_10875 [Mycobacterium sp. ENV421]